MPDTPSPEERKQRIEEIREDYSREREAGMMLNIVPDDLWFLLSELDRREQEHQEELRQLEDQKEATLHMAVARLGGFVEGAPTGRHNFLQRIDALVELEKRYAEEIGQAKEDAKEMKSRLDDANEALYRISHAPAVELDRFGKDDRLAFIADLASYASLVHSRTESLNPHPTMVPKQELHRLMQYRHDRSSPPPTSRLLEKIRGSWNSTPCACSHQRADHPGTSVMRCEKCPCAAFSKDPNVSAWDNHDAPSPPNREAA